MRRVRVHPFAIREIRAAYRWYEGERPGLGAEFLRAVQAALEMARVHPAASTPLGLRTRRALLSRFPYLVLFTIESEQVVVTAIQHMHRDPRGWADRVHDRAVNRALAEA